MTDTPRMPRRRFLAGAAASIAWASAPAPAAHADDADAPVDLPIIDTHQHLWDLDRLTLPWLAPGGPLTRSYTPDDYRKAAEGLNVVKAVYMEVDVADGQHDKEARAVVELIRGGKTPTAAAVIGGRPASDGFKAYVDRFREFPEIKGVRQVLHSSGTPKGYCLDPKFVRGVRLLGEAGWTFDLCMRPGELRDGAALVDACPETSFILDHCGNAPVFGDLRGWKADLTDLAKRGRVVCKVSGIVASTRGRAWSPADLAPVINHVLDAFGPERVMFGGDWPVCTLGAPLRDWVAALKAVVRGRPLAERRKLFHDNAERVYRLRRDGQKAG